MGNNPNRNVADREPSDSLVCRIKLRHCEGKLKYVVRKPFTCSDDFFLTKKTSLQKWIRSRSTPMIRCRHFYYFKTPSTSVSDPPVKSQMALICRSNSLITAFCLQPKLQQASSNACSCSSRSNFVEILSATDLFRNPNGGHKSLTF